MKFIFSFALKNLLRYKRRTLLTFFILSVGIALYILMVGIVHGYKKQSIDNYIKFDTGHLRIRSINFDKDDPYSVSNFMQNAAEVEAVLKTKKYVKAYTERIQFQVDADNGRDSMPCILTGIDLKSDPEVFSLTNYIYKGKLEEGGVMLGKALADDLGLSLNDYVYFTFRNGQGTIDSVEFEVTGLIESTDPMVNNSMGYIMLPDAKKYLNTGWVTAITVITEDLNNDKKYRADLKKDLPQNQIAVWRELTEAIEGAAMQDEITTYIFVIFIAIIAIVGIVNTMLMSVFEKTREIGTLKAMGMTDSEVQGMFVMEGLIIGILGGILGLILGGLVTWYFVAVGYSISDMVGKNNENMMASLRLAGTIRAVWDIPSFIYAFILSVIASTLASYYPAKKTTRMQAAECLRTIQ